jgi:hypothetical protein
MSKTYNVIEIHTDNDFKIETAESIAQIINTIKLVIDTY